MTTVLISADSRYPISRLKIKSAIQSVLHSRNISSDVEISILICGARKSQELAAKYLGDSQPHNVLSFPLADEGSKFAFPTGKSVKGFFEKQNDRLVLGDIVICYPLVQEEANRDNVLVDTKIDELVTHGLLHLLGEHHEG